MLELNPADFVSLESFSLRWRFWPSEVGVAADARRARLHALASDAAARAHYFGLEMFEAMGDADCAELRSLAEPALVEAWLGALPVSTLEAVIVSWDKATALRTDWQFFCRHWDDFCYPSSDDVIVTAQGDQWLLCFRHFEEFTFYRGRRAG